MGGVEEVEGRGGGGTIEVKEEGGGRSQVKSIPSHLLTPFTTRGKLN